MIRHLIILDQNSELRINHGILSAGDKKVALASLASVQSFSRKNKWTQQALCCLGEQCPVILCSWNNKQKKWMTMSLQPRARYVNPLVTERIAKLDTKRATQLVSDMLLAKIQNQHLLLRAIIPSLPALPHYNSHSYTKILSLESKWARYFWAHFFKAAQSDIFMRVKQEASDYLNIALNYGYAFLYHALEWQAILTGLEPGIGICHRLRKNRFSLVCDLIEPFRCCVDVTVIRHLEEMKQTGTMASRFAEMMEQKWIYQGQQRRLRDIIRLNLRQFSKALTDNKATFFPFKLDVLDSCL